MALLTGVQAHVCYGTRYYLYVPENVNAQTPILVSVHGISRNAEDHVNFYVPYARQAGFIVVSPLFDEATYPDYQTLEQCSDLTLIDIVMEVKQITGSTVNKFLLSGSSGGAQFAHRFMLRYPELIERLAVSAAGWYTCPDEDVNYWMGLRYSSEVGGLVKENFLRVPAYVIVGELDNATDETDWAGYGDPNDPRTLQQGAGRYARGQHWIDAMKSAAQALGYDTTYVFEGLPNVGHDFGAKGMCERIVNFQIPQPAVNYGSNVLKNGSFETGNINGWNAWTPYGQSQKWRVDNYDPFNGVYKCDFYSSYAYMQSIHQVVTGIENGKYRVTAWVRQKGSVPPESRMEVYENLGDITQINVNIDHLDVYHRITADYEVRNGQIGVGFFVRSNGGTRLKIDNVEVRKILG